MADRTQGDVQRLNRYWREASDEQCGYRAGNERRRPGGIPLPKRRDYCPECERNRNTDCEPTHLSLTCRRGPALLDHVQPRLSLRAHSNPEPSGEAPGPLLRDHLSAGLYERGNRR